MAQKHTQLPRGTINSVEKRRESMRLAVRALDRVTKKVNRDDNRVNREARTRALSRVKEAKRELTQEEGLRRRTVKALSRRK